jgi:hypothetical protein
MFHFHHGSGLVQLAQIVAEVQIGYSHTFPQGSEERHRKSKKKEKNIVLIETAD